MHAKRLIGLSSHAVVLHQSKSLTTPLRPPAPALRSHFLNYYPRMPSNLLERARTRPQYLAQHPLFDQPGFDSLQADFTLPSFCPPSGVSRVNVWYGSSGTVTPLHFDSYEGILAQVRGISRICSHTAFLCAIPRHVVPAFHSLRLTHGCSQLLRVSFYYDSPRVAHPLIELPALQFRSSLLPHAVVARCRCAVSSTFASTRRASPRSCTAPPSRGRSSAAGRPRRGRRRRRLNNLARCGKATEHSHTRWAMLGRTPGALREECRRQLSAIVQGLQYVRLRYN